MYFRQSKIIAPCAILEKKPITRCMVFLTLECNFGKACTSEFLKDVEKLTSVYFINLNDK